MIRRMLIIMAGFALVLSASVSTSCTCAPSTEDVLDALLDWVATTRGLEKPANLDYEFITSDQLNQKLLDDFEGENTQEELTTNQELLVLLGLIEEDVDLYTMLLDLYTEQIAGYYDYEAKKLYVINDKSTLSVKDKVTFVHEATHALQDHHYDLKSLQDETGDDTEYSAALTAMIEGDAQINEILYIQTLSASEYEKLEQEYEDIDSTKFNAAPRYIQQSILFPYSYGLEFAAELFVDSNRNWNLIDDAYENHPKSTEHIIHLDKYTEGDDPIAVDLPNLELLLGDSWKEMDNGTVGEFDLRMTIEAFITPSEVTAEAAAGWGGDNYAYLKNDDEEKMLVIHSTWDTTDDAQEFFDLYAANKAGTDINDNTWTLLANEPNQKVWATDALVTHMEITESDVLLIVAPNATTASLIRDAVLP